MNDIINYIIPIMLSNNLTEIKNLKETFVDLKRNRLREIQFLNNELYRFNANSYSLIINRLKPVMIKELKRNCYENMSNKNLQILNKLKKDLNNRSESFLNKSSKNYNQNLSDLINDCKNDISEILTKDIINTNKSNSVILDNINVFLGNISKKQNYLANKSVNAKRDLIRCNKYIESCDFLIYLLSDKNFVKPQIDSNNLFINKIEKLYLSWKEGNDNECNT